MTDERPNVLLSINPDPAEAILSGEKLWEYRRVVGGRRFDRRVPRSTLEAADIEPAQNFRYLPDIDPVYAEVNEVTV